jgi:hypothetical protein
MAHERAHDWGFFWWAGAGLLLVFGFIAGFSVGLPFFYAGLIALGVLAARGPRWPAQLGLGAGAGLSCLIVAAAIAAEREPSTGIWALVGGALVAGSALAFWWLRCRPGS